MAPTFAPDRAAFRMALAEMALKAKATLPESAGRIDSAVALVLAGDVELCSDGSALVGSQADPTQTYCVRQSQCECKDFVRAPGEFCKHRLAVGLYRRALELVASVPQASPVETEPEVCQSDVKNPPLPEVPASVTVAGVDPRYVVLIQGKPFIQFAGLLALAHQRGLQELRVTWTYNDAELSLAAATATFPFGTFQEAGDASPSNVNRKVSPHFRRVACTRAAARALRLALGVEVCALEELADETA